MGFADAFWVPISTGRSPFHSKLDKFRFPLHVGEVGAVQSYLQENRAIDPYCSALQKERLILVAAHQSWIRPNTLQTLHCCTADFAGDPGWKERGTHNQQWWPTINQPRWQIRPSLSFNSKWSAVAATFRQKVIIFSFHFKFLSLSHCKNCKKSWIGQNNGANHSIQLFCNARKKTFFFTGGVP